MWLLGERGEQRWVALVALDSAQPGRVQTVLSEDVQAVDHAAGEEALPHLQRLAA
jgi:hypothetical protein